DILVGIQDMGAAGIACSTFEMSARGRSGMDVRLDEIPLREKGMNAWEIFLSESQERMLLVAAPSNVNRVKEIARKWEIDCVEVGTVTDTGRVVAHYHGEKVVDLPVHPVTDGGPLYDRPSKPPVKKTAVIKSGQLPSTKGMEEAILKLQGSPNLSSRWFVYHQYDHTVGTDTVVIPGSDAAIMRIKGFNGALGITLDSNAYYCDSDPYLGMVHVMAEAVRNLACTGARGIAVTNCLNFGSPELPEVMGQLKESIRGLSDACRLFDTPVTGGNVSLYNQTGTMNIKPTPAIGMIGWMENLRHRVTTDFKASGDVVALLGSPAEEALYQSEYARSLLGRDDLACPPIDLQREKALQEALLSLAEEGILSSAHDCSDGGISQTIIESCLANSLNPIGVSVSIPSGFHSILFLFGEYASRAVISFRPEMQNRVEAIVRANGIRMVMIGKTGGDQFRIEGECSLPLTLLAERRESFFKAL
ncbi:MAG TPA: AIR synthase-related protein, partial [Bdellovibrionota bacterium]|nr:AIR synthase-related protein [Bdellovibrionota bacterium]